nr:acyl-coenzyme a:6-aminopenicillanic-acid-acyltransferase 40 kda form [Quercus suber]
MIVPDNAIPIEGWISDPTDNDLLHLIPFLESLQYVTDIGKAHGSQAKLQISRSIAFYTSQFQESANLSWPEVRVQALRFRLFLQARFLGYLEEMRGIAAGAEVAEIDILAINVRTEITFGMFTDGCTALSWLTPRASWLAQNWDWELAQQENLVLLTVEQPGKPRIQMVTEAGLIGKIGFNDAGVGVCLNAVRQRGADVARLPCHVGLRVVLESRSRKEAVTQLEEFGVASSCHMLIADSEGATGLECSSTGIEKLEMNVAGHILHTNHYVLEHREGPGAGGDYLGDSISRLSRIQELVTAIPRSDDGVNKEQISRLFEDEENYPTSICRMSVDGKSTLTTLFNIVMELKSKSATVKVGRPIEPEEVIELAF